MIASSEKVKFLQVNYDAIFQLSSSLIRMILAAIDIHLLTIILKI